MVGPQYDSDGFGDLVALLLSVRRFAVLPRLH
jgi:hypothetical protein